MEFRGRTFDGDGGQADVDFGRTLMLNRNRCIMCTRCVRFMKEVDATRRSASSIAASQPESPRSGSAGVHSLLSGKTDDVVSGGAITTRDYRFKSRPWTTRSGRYDVARVCSKGCSTTAWLKAKPEWTKGARLHSLHAPGRTRA